MSKTRKVWSHPTEAGADLQSVTKKNTKRALQELNLLGCRAFPISINTAEVEKGEASFYRKEYRFAKEDDR